MRLASLLPLLVACAPSATSLSPLDTEAEVDDTPDVADTDVSAVARCDARVAWLSPDDATTHVPVDAAVQAAFDAPLPDGAAWSLDVVGVPGEATLSADRRLATFTPAAPLDADTAYTIAATACDDAAEATFHTLGRPVDLDDLAGRTWNVALAELSWVSPASSSTVLPLFDMPAVLTHAASRPDGVHLLARFAASIDGRVLPIPCAPAFDLGVMTLTGNPRFTTDGVGFTIPWRDEVVTAEDVHVEGYLDDGGGTLSSMSFRGLLDVRPLEAITGLRGLCDQAPAYGEACEPCADGAVACLPALVTDGSATEVPADDFHLDPLDLLGLCD